MKLRFFISVAAFGLLTMPALTPAQARPEFSGRWKISQARSSPGAVGNGAKVGFPSELVIQHHPAELQVEMRIPRTDPMTALYKLDGTEVTLGTPAGIAEKARAMWDGEKLVITARRVISTSFGDFVTDSKEVWSRTGNVLTISKTQTADGVSQTETGVFDKDP